MHEVSYKVVNRCDVGLDTHSHKKYNLITCSKVAYSQANTLLLSKKLPCSCMSAMLCCVSQVVLYVGSIHTAAIAFCRSSIHTLVLGMLYASPWQKQNNTDWIVNNDFIIQVVHARYMHWRPSSALVSREFRLALLRWHKLSRTIRHHPPTKGSGSRGHTEDTYSI